MAIWILKACTQKVISYLPYRHSINHFFQKHITKGLLLTNELFETKLVHCHQHISAYKKYSSENESFISLELGTGWYPIIPLGLFLCNANAIYTIDIEMLLSQEKSIATINKFIEYHRSGKLRPLLPFYSEEKLNKLVLLAEKNASLEEIHAVTHIKTIVGNLLTYPFAPDLKFQLIHSNNTFEHIPEPVLIKMLYHFKNLITQSGVMSHFIDMSDHFAHFDKKITEFNYLRFSDTQWKFIDNSIQPQNRLRINNYRDLYAKTRWLIKEEVATSGSENDLSTVKHAKKFSHISKNDLLVTHALVIS